MKFLPHQYLNYSDPFLLAVLILPIIFRGSGNAVQIVQRHHFASHLKRMAVVVRNQEQFLAFVKVFRSFLYSLFSVEILNVYMGV